MKNEKSGLEKERRKRCLQWDEAPQSVEAGKERDCHSSLGIFTVIGPNKGGGKNTSKGFQNVLKGDIPQPPQTLVVVHPRAQLSSLSLTTKKVKTNKKKNQKAVSFTKKNVTNPP